MFQNMTRACFFTRVYQIAEYFFFYCDHNFLEQRVSEAALGVDPEYQWRRNQHQVIIFNVIVQLWGNLKYVYFVEIEKGSTVWKLKIWKLAPSYFHGYENWERRGMWDSLIFKLLLTDCLLLDRPIEISITSFDFLKGCKTLKKDLISNSLTWHWNILPAAVIICHFNSQRINCFVRRKNDESERGKERERESR